MTYQETDAILSECGLYRYLLWRSWADGPSCVFIMLNPSTADARQDDPTIRRCVGYAKSWGYGSLAVLNLFAFRSTDPKALATTPDPVGPENDTYIQLWTRSPTNLVVAAWGADKAVGSRGREVVARLTERGIDVRCLGVTRGGCPAHPLYQPADLLPIPFAFQATGPAVRRVCPTDMGLFGVA